MYFLTNSEDYIVSASSNFLNAIGTREICSISTMLQNQLITIDKDNNKLNIPSKNLEYEYKISNMHSAFGNLNLYTLATPTEDKKIDENIAYLKKIQEGTVEQKDNEYDIPTIDVLKKDKQKDTLIDNITPSGKNDTLEDSIIKSEDKSSYETKQKETTSFEDTQILEKSEHNELIESLKSIGEESSIEKLADEIIETGNKEEIEKKSIDNLENNNNKSELTEQVVKIDNKEPKQKESSLKRITKKLFPWGSKKNQDYIELEDNTSYETDLKSAKELEAETKTSMETIKDNIEDTKNDSSDIKVIDLSAEEINYDKNDTVENNKNELDDSIVIPEIPSIALEDDNIKQQEIKIEDKKEERDSIKLEQNKSENDNTKLNIAQEDIVSKVDSIETQKDENVLETKIDTIESTQAKISEAASENENLKQDNIKYPEEKTDEEELSVSSKDNNKITYKLMKLQIDSIDIEKNANKLSIDSKSYKMLLANYLDEIEKYNSELENGITSTIDMLQDAGELLSLNSLTQKLESLKSNTDRRETAKEISLMVSLLKEKIETTNNEAVNIEQIKEDNSEVLKVEKQEIEEEKKSVSIPPVPDEIIDITSAQDLLASINPQSVSFNPNRAADELNLPKSLILEFVEDFISQAKEHLPIIVDAYKKEDIKTIQTTAHMLKGAASNLRLDTIAENLFKIQKEGNINNSGELIKQFVAKIKGLSSEVASLEDAEDEN